MSSPEEGEGAPTQTSRFEVWFRPFLEDSALWPVTLAAGASLSVFGAMVLLLALRERSVYAALVLAALAGATFDALWRARRVGRAGLLIAALAALWIASGSLAWLALRLGLF